MNFADEKLYSESVLARGASDVNVGHASLSHVSSLTVLGVDRVSAFDWLAWFITRAHDFGVTAQSLYIIYYGAPNSQTLVHQLYV